MTIELVDTKKQEFAVLMREQEIHLPITEGAVRREPAVSWPGLYNTHFEDKNGDKLCAACAADEYADGFEVKPHVKWEGEPEVCTHCTAELPPVYGEE